MYKRTKCEIYLTKEEQQLIIDYFKFTKSLSKSARLGNCLLWRRGLDVRIDYRCVKRFLERIDPIMVQIILRQRQEERMKWRQEKRQKHEQSIADYMIIQRRQK